jgi:hypothetical protein
VTIVGVLLSGPIALWIVHRVHPQPAWQGSARFAAELHPVQLLPYLGGFVLIGGCVALIASLQVLVPREPRARGYLALVLAAAFAALIVLNYVLQTTFVPSLVTPYAPVNDSLVAAFSMANPRSLAWALEMWGYAVFGGATWAIEQLIANCESMIGLKMPPIAFGVSGMIVTYLRRSFAVTRSRGRRSRRARAAPPGGRS